MKTMVMMIVAMALLAGCTYRAEHGEPTYAKITVRGRTEAELRQAMEKHFGVHHWALRTNAPAAMVFERRANETEQFWFREFGAPPIMRVARVYFMEGPDGITIAASKVTEHRALWENTDFQDNPAELRKILESFQ